MSLSGYNCIKLLQRTYDKTGDLRGPTAGRFQETLSGLCHPSMPGRDCRNKAPSGNNPLLFFCPCSKPIMQDSSTAVSILLLPLHAILLSPFYYEHLPALTGFLDKNVQIKITQMQLAIKCTNAITLNLFYIFNTVRKLFEVAHQ